MHARGRRRFGLGATVLAVALVASACGGGSEDGGEQDSNDAAGQASGECPIPAEPQVVRFAPTAPLPAYWPYYYIAEPLGFYEDEGIEIQFENTTTAVQQALLAGRLDLSGTGLDYIQQAPTLDNPPKWFMNVDRYLWIFTTFADSGVESVEDLRGAKIGINEPDDALDADFMMGVAGVPQGEYELIPVGQDRAALVAMERGEIDAFMTAGAVSMVALSDFTDRELVVVKNDVTERYYNMGNMLTLDQLDSQEDRCLAIRFGRAVARGMIWTWENPQTTGELLYEVAPDSAESVEQAIRFVEAGNEAHRATYEARGAMEADIYQEMIDKHAELGLIEESYDAEMIFTNEFIDAIWDFDVDAEIERARNDER